MKQHFFGSARKSQLKVFCERRRGYEIKDVFRLNQTKYLLSSYLASEQFAWQRWFEIHDITHGQHARYCYDIGIVAAPLNSIFKNIKKSQIHGKFKSILNQLMNHITYKIWPIDEYGSTGDTWNIEETVRIPSDEMMHEILASWLLTSIMTANTCTILVTLSKFKLHNFFLPKILLLNSKMTELCQQQYGSSLLVTNWSSSLAVIEGELSTRSQFNWRYLICTLPRL